MTRSRGTAALVASPVLVGAVTVLITVIAVFIAYNANKGLPFVPTYDVKAQLPSAAKNVKGNEVRVGGFRVGVIDNIVPSVTRINGDHRAIAEVSLKLDKTLEPLAVDTKLRTRPRSALGLKYLQIIPGRAKKTFAAGDVIPVKNASQPLELEDVLQILDRKTRASVRQVTTGFGDAFAGRGASLNTAIGALNPLFRHLTPVMRNLADPDTQLDQFFLQVGKASAQLAPVAHTQAVLFTDMADTFAAISRDPGALQATIEKSPPTLDVSIRSLAVQRPFLADFTDLSRRLRPAARELPRSLPRINAAFRIGIPVLPRTVKLSKRLKAAFKAADDLFKNPNTLLTLRDIRAALTVTKPAIQFIAPYQTVCNHLVYFIHPLSELQSSVQNGPTGGGTVLQNNNKLVDTSQKNTFGTITGSRDTDVSPDQDPRGATKNGQPQMRLYGTPYNPAVDAQGNADCQVGQFGFPKGPLAIPGGRYNKGTLADGTPSGGNWAIVENNLPGLRGATYKARQLGINNVRDVP